MQGNTEKTNVTNWNPPLIGLPGIVKMNMGINKGGLLLKSMEHDGEMNYGGLLCRTGLEERVAEEIRKRIPGLKAVVARQKSVVCKNGVHSIDSVNPFPGYVFFVARKDFDIQTLMRIKGISEVLTNPDGTWMLQGEARALAAFLFSKEHYNNLF